MQFSITQSSLSKALSIVAPAVGKSSIFSMVALEAIDGAGLRLTARDIEGGISCFLSASVEESGGVLMPEKLLAELIGQFPPERVDFRAKSSNQRVEIKCARSVANIPYEAIERFPELRSNGGEHGFRAVPIGASARRAEFAADTLRQIIERTTFAASSDISRPTLTGVDVQLSGIAAKFATTDGFRLAIAEAALEQEFGEGAKTIIPAHRLNALTKLLAEASDASPVVMHFGGNWALFSIACGEKSPFTTVEMETALIDNKFPDYNAIIPKSSAMGVRVSRNELEKAISVAGLYARDNANIVRFKITNVNGETGLKVSATSPEMGDCAIDVNVSASDTSMDAFEIAFNYKFVLDYLRRADAELWIEFTNSVRPARIQSAYDRAGKDFYALMPMQPK